jgi:hypothetical protein
MSTAEAFSSDGLERQKELWEGILAGYSPDQPLMLPFRQYQAVRRILRGGRFGQLRRRLYARTIKGDSPKARVA